MMIPLFLGEIWAMDTFFLLPCKLKRLHSQRGVQYWGCSGPSDPSGCFARELGQILPSAEFGVFVGYLLTSATLQGLRRQAPWQALKRACRNVCVFVPKSAL